MLEYYENDDFAWTAELEKHANVVRAELDQLDPRDFGAWPRGEIVEHDWNLFQFFTPGKRFHKHCQACPETVRLVDRIPGIKMATFSWLRPQSHIKPHRGFTSIVLRSHLALKVPPQGDIGLRIGSTTKRWEEGKVFVFDDMNEHEAWNWSEEERVVLMLDFLRPFRYRTSTLGFLRQRLFPPASYARSYERVEEESQS